MPPSGTTRSADRGARFLWPLLSTPGSVWLLLLFVVPLYASVAVAFSTETDPFSGAVVTTWNPLEWRADTFLRVIDESLFGIYRDAWIRTLLYSGLALTLITLIGYPIAYYTARLAGSTRALLLGLLLMPWWINFLTRMLAWNGLLAENGVVNGTLRTLHLSPVGWLNGKWWVVVIALVYGYLPYLIIPMYAYLDYIDESLLEASRDLGANSFRTFFCVTLPLSRVGLMTSLAITALPMFGDYYTNTLVSTTTGNYMIGNMIVENIYQGFAQPEAASLVILLSGLLLVFMAYYLVVTIREARTD